MTSNIAHETVTDRQLAILRAIRDYSAEHGYPPTTREVGCAVGLSSTSSVAHQLMALDRAQFITRAPSRARALLLTDAGRALIEEEDARNG